MVSPLARAAAPIFISVVKLARAAAPIFISVVYSNQGSAGRPRTRSSGRRSPNELREQPQVVHLIAVGVFGDGPGVDGPAVVEVRVALLRRLHVRGRRARRGAQRVAGANRVPVVAGVRAADEETWGGAIGRDSDFVPLRALVGEP